MKLESTNITLIANEDMNLLTIGENGKTPAFIKEEYILELRDLINDYLVMKHKPI